MVVLDMTKSNKEKDLLIPAKREHWGLSLSLQLGVWLKVHPYL